MKYLACLCLGWATVSFHGGKLYAAEAEFQNPLVIEEKNAHQPLLVLGGGPGSLAFVLFLLEMGYKDPIQLIYDRSGERKRMLITDRKTKDLLGSHTSEDFLQRITSILSYHNLTNDGVYSLDLLNPSVKQLIQLFYGDREMSGATEIGNLELAILRAIRNHSEGGQTSLQIFDNTQVKSVQTINRAGLVEVETADGRKFSGWAAINGMGSKSPVPKPQWHDLDGGRKSHYYIADIPLSQTGPDAKILIRFHPEMVIFGYLGSTGLSINATFPSDPGPVHPDNPNVARFLEAVREMAPSTADPQVRKLEVGLGVSRELRTGRVFHIGDAIRSNDFVAGTGANAAIQDARAAAEFIHGMRSLPEPEDLKRHLLNYGQLIVENSIHAMAHGIYFREVISRLGFSQRGRAIEQMETLHRLDAEKFRRPSWEHDLAEAVTRVLSDQDDVASRVASTALGFYSATKALNPFASVFNVDRILAGIAHRTSPQKKREAMLAAMNRLLGGTSPRTLADRLRGIHGDDPLLLNTIASSCGSAASH